MSSIVLGTQEMAVYKIALMWLTFYLERQEINK